MVVRTNISSVTVNDVYIYICIYMCVCVCMCVCLCAYQVTGAGTPAEGTTKVSVAPPCEIMEGSRGNNLDREKGREREGRGKEEKYGDKNAYCIHANTTHIVTPCSTSSREQVPLLRLRDRARHPQPNPCLPLSLHCSCL